MTQARNEGTTQMGESQGRGRSFGVALVVVLLVVGLGAYIYTAPSDDPLRRWLVESKTTTLTVSPSPTTKGKSILDGEIGGFGDTLPSTLATTTTTEASYLSVALAEEAYIDDLSRVASGRDLVVDPAGARRLGHQVCDALAEAGTFERRNEQVKEWVQDPEDESRMMPHIVAAAIEHLCPEHSDLLGGQ